MAMTEADKALVREAAREIVNEAGPAIAKEAAWNVIKEHIQTCPVRQEVAINGLKRRISTLKLIIGVLLLGGAGGSGGALVMKLFHLL